MADHFKVGRVFIVGDAAHVHPPTGGQGLNSSVQDSVSLITIAPGPHTEVVPRSSIWDGSLRLL